MPGDFLRILTTNDFFGSFFPQPTSYGTLPGAQGLIETVGRLRGEARASLWIDTGDFSPGGPLAPISAGTLGFVGAGQLGIDVAVVGNHDLDWGEQHLQRWGPELGCPLLCGNYDLGLPATAVVASEPWTIGLIGLTHPELGRFNRSLTRDQPPPAALVRQHAQALRRDGVDFVVLAIHAGVEWIVGQDGQMTTSPQHVAELCDAFDGEVDAVVGGHTLGRWVGGLGGVPFVQPWAFGAEVGVVDLYPGGDRRPAAVAVDEGGLWRGPGRGAHEELAAEIVGHVPEPLVNAPGRSASMLTALADGVLRTTPADAALVVQFDATYMQPPIDGVLAYLPAGPISEADLLRTIPFTGDVNGDAICLAEVSLDEVERLTRRAAVELGTDKPDVVQREGSTVTLNGLILALSSHHIHLANTWLGRDAGWRRLEVGLRDALRAAVAR